MKNAILLFFSFCISVTAPSQTLRQVILYSDVIAIGNDKIINSKSELISDVEIKNSHQTEYTFISWLKTNKKTKQLPKTIIENSSPIPYFDKNALCVPIARGISSNETLYTIYFLKQDKKGWNVLDQKVFNNSEFDRLAVAINQVLEIEKIRNVQYKFDAYVDWILTTESDGLSFFTRAIRELDSTSAFMRFYKQNGINDINSKHKELLFKFLEAEIYNPEFYSEYIDNSLIYLVYAEFKEAINAALLNRLAYEYRHLADMDSDEINTTSTYNLESTILTYYEFDKTNPIINSIGIANAQYEYIFQETLIEKVALLLSEKGLIKD